ncbi:fibronectin type III domain-containing protein [Paenibacillus harenae]|uniref:fibronectin type III domain-containing protein n=1 Tax=Paenibacillus harenae TaxID=306543 RepID=UPI00278EFB15|nr:fibronectin type III domain-containing protein [Paenibacillus harenae]MDQ0062736.1 hypothetical protein [Paenibacillus harenae]
MRRRFMLLVCGFLMLSLLLPFQADAAGTDPETRLFQVDGIILDFDENRIAWKQPGYHEVLWLYNRTDKSQIKIFDPSETGAYYPIGIHLARLSAEGVFYSHSRGLGYYGSALQGWDEHSGDLHEVNGNFAVFTNGVANLATGEFRTLPTSGLEFASYIQFDLSIDGTVVYTDPDPTSESGLYKSLPDGTLTTYAPSSNYRAYSGAMTDGKNIIYKALARDDGSDSKWSLQVRSANGEITTVAQNAEDQWSDPQTSYQINNGWIAYREYDAEKDRWILYARSPEGVERQVFATDGAWNGPPLSIKKLGPDGTVAYKLGDTTYIHSAQVGKLLYSFSGPGELEYREHVFAGGPWYRVDGGSLYSIQVAYPEAPQWPEGDVLTVTGVTYNSVHLNWLPARDETGVDEYMVFQNNTLLETLNGDVNSYEVKGLSPNSSYLFSLVAVDAAGNQSVKQEATITTAAYATPGSFQLSDSRTYSDGWYNYEFSLYYGYISSSGQELSGSWSPPEDFRGVVKVSMGSPEGEDYDLSLETVGEGNRTTEDTTKLPDGTEFSAAEVPEGYRAEWRVKGHTDKDYSPDKKVFVYVSIKYDNH